MEKEQILEMARQLDPKLREIWQDLHRHPELGFEEVYTARKVAEVLRGLEMEVHDQVGGTGVVGIIRGAHPGKTLLLRADMDALPIQERTDVPWKSVIPGRIHSCGHDSHVAVLIGTAWLLDKIREELAGTIRFVFQPGEENKGMGRDLVEAGAITDPPPDACFAFHAFPQGNCGDVTIWNGMMTAYLKGFHLTVAGDEKFQKRLDLAQSAAFLAEYFAYAQKKLVQDLQTECEVEGSLRYMLEDDGEKLRLFHENFLAGLAAKYGLFWKIEYNAFYLPVICNPKCSDLVRKTVEALGMNSVKVAGEAMISSEDFAFFLQKCPGADFAMNFGAGASGSHCAYYDVNDDMLKPAILTMSGVAVRALDELNRNPQAFS